MKIELPAVITFFLLSAMSCADEGTQTNHSENDTKDVQEQLIQHNIDRVAMENERIEAFIKRRQWPMESSGTGLRYWVMEEGGGDSVNTGDFISVRFEVTLLDGTVCYSNLNGEPEWFKVGMDQVESGLHEGVTYLRVGDRAKIILPAHLAHGLVGDQNKIPPNAAVIYDLQVLDIK